MVVNIFYFIVYGPVGNVNVASLCSFVFFFQCCFVVYFSLWICASSGNLPKFSDEMKKGRWLSEYKVVK